MPRWVLPTNAKPRWYGIGAPGGPYYNAIVWQDTRTDRIASALDRDGRGDVIRRKAGLPPATYFSGGKLQWILENVDGVREAAESGDALFGTADTWVLWNLTGGPRGGVHVTDVTNASRTMLMNLETLDWDDELLSFFSIPRAMLPAIAPSSPLQPYGVTRGDRARRRRGADHRRPRRPACGDGRSGVSGRGGGEKHLRHRQFPAAQHRRDDRAVARTAC